MMFHTNCLVYNAKYTDAYDHQQHDCMYKLTFMKLTASTILSCFGYITLQENLCGLMLLLEARYNHVLTRRPLSSKVWNDVWFEFTFSVLFGMQPADSFSASLSETMNA